MADTKKTVINKSTHEAARENGINLKNGMEFPVTKRTERNSMPVCCVKIYDVKAL